MAYREEFLFNPKVLDKADFGNPSGMKLLFGSRLKTADNSLWCECKVFYDFGKDYYRIIKGEEWSDGKTTLAYMSIWYFFTKDTVLDGVTYSAGIWESETYSQGDSFTATTFNPKYKHTTWREGKGSYATSYVSSGYIYFDLENMVNLSAGMDSLQEEFRGYSTITDYEVSGSLYYELGVSTTDYPELVQELFSGSQYSTLSEWLTDIARATQELRGDSSTKILGSAIPFEIRKAVSNTASGKPLEVNSLPSSGKNGVVYKVGGLRGTAVPNSGYAEKVYFNKNIDMLKLAEILSLYGEEMFLSIPSLLDYPFYPILASEDGTPILIIVNCESYFMILAVLDIGAGESEEIGLFEATGVTWYVNEYAINKNIVSNLLEIPVGWVNEGLKDLISITPYENDYYLCENGSFTKLVKETE